MTKRQRLVLSRNDFPRLYADDWFLNKQAEPKREKMKLFLREIDTISSTVRYEKRVEFYLRTCSPWEVDQAKERADMIMEQKRECIRKQREIRLRLARLLKPGDTVAYRWKYWRFDEFTVKEVNPFSIISTRHIEWNVAKIQSCTGKGWIVKDFLWPTDKKRPDDLMEYFCTIDKIVVLLQKYPRDVIRHIFET